MTEHDWLASDDPAGMLRHLTHEIHRAEDAIGDHPRDRALISDRKLRLFACACCRLAWDEMPDERSRRAVATAEQYADGGATVFEMRRQEAAVLDPRRSILPPDICASLACSRRDDCGCEEILILMPTLRAVQAALLREIVGNPFSPYALPPHVRTPRVLELAEMAYAERSEGRECPACKGAGGWSSSAGPKGGAGGQMITACRTCDGEGRLTDGTLDPDRLAILCDALEEAGLGVEQKCGRCRGLGFLGGAAPGQAGWIGAPTCPECKGGVVPDALLAHLRSPGPHVRGCWSLDLVLGKG